MKPSELVNQMYANEADLSIEEAFSKTVSINLEIKDASMLKAISERMKTSVFNLGGEIIHNAIEEMFWAFSDSDKVEIAVKADEYTKADFDKKGIKVEGFYAHQAKGDWEGLALFVIESRKKQEAERQLDIEDQIGKGESE